VQSTVGLTETFVKRRPEAKGSGNKKEKGGVVSVDDAFISLLRFKSGAIGSIEASRFCAGRKNYARIELHGTEGSMLFNLERLNELQFYSERDAEKRIKGFRTVSVTSAIHPYVKNWWPEGHVLGWEHAMVHEMYHFFNAVGRDEGVAPLGATFEDGVRADEIIEAITRSTLSRRWENAS
jgi:predicted dehydrogenase